ncbi:MAG: hypothetical protein ABWX82_05740 [Leifsonia sp.]
MEIDEGTDPRFQAPCPSCGDAMYGSVLGSGDARMLLSLSCLSGGYSALVDPFD